MRGYFGIGVEGISKPMNLGNLLRSAHAFGASFFFTVDAGFNPREVKLSDTADSARHLPLYDFGSVGELLLPRGCRMVGVELAEDAVELPSFHHPCQNPDKVLRQRRRRWRDCDVRPLAEPRPIRQATRNGKGQSRVFAQPCARCPGPETPQGGGTGALIFLLAATSE